ncbi:unnamed protein product [Spirodela intermedia]|uniref:Uncharacterized protein n=1 Tax=Spirodela intermedia TaxID=51605 RepID=A0A7I8IY80_SPIIN|nr:unnamed protein product [Spirodela intermedia]CAA6662966.1 unnamed protein product [Spirodela intermedia]
MEEERDGRLPIGGAAAAAAAGGRRRLPGGVVARGSSKGMGGASSHGRGGGEVSGCCFSSVFSSSLSSAGNGGESRWPVRCHLQRKGERWPLVELARRAFDSGIERGTIWSFTAVAGLTALLLYSNHRYRREKLRLLLLIKEKDQTITWLSQHIAQMNELMAARLIVPVARSA